MASCYRHPSGCVPSRRLFKLNPVVMSSSSRPHSNQYKSQLAISPGQDEEEIVGRLDSLLSVANGRWSLTSDGKGLERTFHFKTFKGTWVSGYPYSREATVTITVADVYQNFMNSVAEQCKKERHHPEWSNVCCSCAVFGALDEPQINWTKS